MANGLSNKCPECKKSFKVLPDESNMHECPFCGYHPSIECKEDNPEPMDLEFNTDDIESMSDGVLEQFLLK